MAAASLAARPGPSLPRAAGARGGGDALTHSASRVQQARRRDEAPAAVVPAAAAVAGHRRRCRLIRSSTSGSNARGTSPTPAAGAHLAAAAQLAAQLAAQPNTDGRQRQRQRQRQRHGAPSSSKQSELEQTILRQRSMDDLLALLEDSGNDMPPAAAAAALYQLSELRQAGGNGVWAAVTAHPALPCLLSALEQGAGELHIRSLVRVLACCRDLGLQPLSLADELADQLVRRLPAVAPAQASNALRDLTRLGSEDGRDSLLSAVNALVERQQRELAAAGAASADGQQPLPPWLAQLTVAQLLALLWVCAKAAFRSQPLLHGITQAMLAGGCRREGQQLQRPWQRQQRQQQQRHQRSTHAAVERELAADGTDAGAAGGQPLARLGPGQLSSLFYSLGALRWAASDEFIEHAAAAVEQQLPSLNSQGLANIAWGISHLPSRHPALQRLVHALYAAAAPRLASFSPQELGMVAIACEHMPDCSPKLLEALGQQLQQRAAQLADRDITTLLAAFATVRHPLPTPALDAAARRLEQLLAPQAPRTACSPVALAWALWAFGRLHYRPPRSLLRRADSALRGPAAVALYELEPADLARLVWGLAEAGYYSGGLLSDLATVLRSMWQHMPPQSMAMVLRSYATLGFTPHELLDAAAEHMALNLPQYSTQAVAMVTWSFAKLGVHPNRGLPDGGPCTPEGTPLLAAIADFALQHVRQQQQVEQQQQQAQQQVEQQQQQAQQQQAQQSASGEGQPAAGHAQEPFTLQGLSMLLWAFGALDQHPGGSLLEAAAERYTQALQQLAAGGAAAAAAEAEAAAGAAAALNGGTATQDHQEQLNLQSVATAAWAFSKLQHPPEAFFAAVADALPALVAELAEEPAPAAAEPAAAKGRATAGTAGRARGRKDEPHAVASLAYAAAKLRVAAGPRTLQSLLPMAARHMDGFTAGEVSQLLWASAQFQLPSPPPVSLLDAAASRLAATAGSCDASLLCMAVHALATLGYRAEDALLDTCVSQVAAAGPGTVPVSWLAKLLWGCAHVGHVPDVEHLEAICDDLYFRLSHARGNRTLLYAPDLVLMVWALAVLEQYGCRLYRHTTFRAKRLPDGVPAQPRLRRLLREATTLHSAEHRLDPVVADAASAILPVWMAAEQQQQQGQQQQQDAAVEPPVQQLSPAAAAPTGSEAGAGSGDASGATQRDLRAAAQAAAGALQRAGIPALLMQLSFGDFIVVFDRRGSSAGSSRRPAEGSQAAVVPAPAHLGRACVNTPHRLVGSALVACRVLAARGVTAVPHTGGEVELLAACAELRQQ